MSSSLDKFNSYISALRDAGKSPSGDVRDNVIALYKNAKRDTLIFIPPTLGGTINEIKNAGMRLLSVLNSRGGDSPVNGVQIMRLNDSSDSPSGAGTWAGRGTLRK